MSLQHTVVFRLVHPAGSTHEQEFLETAHRLLPSIPGVTEFAVNRQVSSKSDLAWQFSMVFVDQAAYEAYNDHPVHQDSSQPGGPLRWSCIRSTTSKRMLSRAILRVE